MFITRKELKQHFKFPKMLPKPVEFYPAKSLKLPKPLHKLRNSHYCTDLLNVGDNYRIAFVWKEGQEWKRCQIYAYFFIHLEPENCLYPLARIDYHPSHKGLHIVLHCEDNRNLSNRNIPSGKEFNLRLDHPIDPRLEADRQRFIKIVCKRLGIKNDSNQ